MSQITNRPHPLFLLLTVFALCFAVGCGGEAPEESAVSSPVSIGDGDLPPSGSGNPRCDAYERYCNWYNIAYYCDKFAAECAPADDPDDELASVCGYLDGRCAGGEIAFCEAAVLICP